MDKDIKKRRYNKLLEIQEEKPNNRNKFIMNLVYLLRLIENCVIVEEREALKYCFYDLVEEAKLTELERRVFEFEANNLGI